MADRQDGHQGTEPQVLLFLSSLPQCLANSIQDLAGLDWLEDKVACAGLKRIDRVLQRAIGCHNDHRHAGVEFLGTSYHRQTICFGHHEIDQQQVESLLIEARQGVQGTLVPLDGIARHG
jgi:hypothetical protein